MSSLLAESGPVLWVTAPLGLAALAAALWFALTAVPRFRNLAIGLVLTSLAAGAFGTVTGLRRVLGAIPTLPVEERWILVEGVRESLTCFTAALALAVAVGIVLSVGSLRSSQHDAPLARRTREPIASV